MKPIYVALIATSILLSADKKKSNDYTNNSKNMETIGCRQQRYEIKQAVEDKVTEANEELLHEAVLFKRF